MYFTFYFTYVILSPVSSNNELVVQREGKEQESERAREPESERARKRESEKRESEKARKVKYKVTYFTLTPVSSDDELVVQRKGNAINLLLACIYITGLTWKAMSVMVSQM